MIEETLRNRRRPAASQHVTTVVTVAILGWIATGLAAVVLIAVDDVRDYWWITLGAALLFGAATTTSAVRLSAERTRYLQDMETLAALVTGPGQNDEPRRAAEQERAWAVRAGELEVAARLGEALEPQPPDAEADTDARRPS